MERHEGGPIELRIEGGGPIGLYVERRPELRAELRAELLAELRAEGRPIEPCIDLPSLAVKKVVEHVLDGE